MISKSVGIDRGGGLSLERYSLASRFPVIWQTRLIWVCAYTILLCFAAFISAAISTTGLKANRVPDLTTPFRLFLLASAIATWIWFILSTQHFRVGVVGYKIASPWLICLCALVTLIWVPPFLYAYLANVAVEKAATESHAGAGYLKIQRAASLLNIGAEAHTESLVTIDEVKPITSRDEFTSTYILDIAMSSIEPLEIFGPETLRGAFADLMKIGVPNCARDFSLKSKSATVAEIRADFERQRGLAQTEQERMALSSNRALQLENAELDFDVTQRKFNECAAKAMDHTNLSREELVKGFRAAQRNAYLIQYGYKSFGLHSTDHLQYIKESNFAAPELSPFGYGDIGVVAFVLLLVVFVSIYYIGGEYADPSAVAATIRNSFIGAMLLFLLLPLAGFVGPIPVQQGSHPIETWAATAHWPSLVILLVAVLAILAVITPVSTSRSRQTVLAIFLLLPLLFEIQTLNAINTLSINYWGGTCPTVGWPFADRIHCALYAEWQPLIRDASMAIAKEIGWDQFLTSAGARVAVATILSILLTFASSLIVIPLLMRECVRPRDR